MSLVTTGFVLREPNLRRGSQKYYMMYKQHLEFITPCVRNFSSLYYFKIENVCCKINKNIIIY